MVRAMTAHVAVPHSCVLKTWTYTRVSKARFPKCVCASREELLRLLVDASQSCCRLQAADVQLAASVLEERQGVIILLSGAAGTGKSTLASLLGQRLGISNVLSTDSIRHALRCAPTMRMLRTCVV